MRNSLQFDNDINKIARWLSRGNTFLAEELRSVMHIAILDMEEGWSRPYYLRSARNKAIDHLRSRQIRDYLEHVSLEAMQDAGFQIDTTGRVYAPLEFL